jgi:hypothetical protein
LITPQDALSSFRSLWLDLQKKHKKQMPSSRFEATRRSLHVSAVAPPNPWLCKASNRPTFASPLHAKSTTPLTDEMPLLLDSTDRISPSTADRPKRQRGKHENSTDNILHSAQTPVTHGQKDPFVSSWDNGASPSKGTPRKAAMKKHENPTKPHPPQDQRQNDPFVSSWDGRASPPKGTPRKAAMPLAAAWP